MSNQEMALLPDKNKLMDIDKRLAVMLPGAAKLSAGERYALAQIAVMHGLDPLNGEVWMIPGRGPMIGIKGLRKKAREQVRGNFWVEFKEITDPEDRKRYGIDAGALAFEAHLFDSENIRTYCDLVEVMTKAGIPWEEVKTMLGNKPYTSGIGVLKPAESTKMERVQCAMKRAEADALKRRFDMPFGMQVSAEIDDDIPSEDWKVEGEVIEQEVIDPKAVLAANKKQLGRDDSGL